MTDRELMQQALETLVDKCIATYAIHGISNYMIVDDGKARNELLNALRERLAREEPVANAAAWWTLVMGATASIEDALNCLRDEDAKRQAIGAMKHYREKANALYTAPPRQWVGLTEQEQEVLWDEAVDRQEHFCSQYGDFAAAIEAKLRGKNQ